MQVVSDRFHDLARGQIRPHDWGVNISFTKERNDEVGWFVWDQSVWDGGDLWATEDDNPTQVWDAYKWENYRDRLIEMSFERSVEFPYNVQSTIADFSLNNYDRYFTFTESVSDVSPISQYILPKRPVRLYLGFKTAEKVPVFVGVTQGIPTYSGRDDEVANFTAMDFLSEIGNQELKETVMMRDVTTDLVIAAILQQYGMTPDMYSLSAGQNKIPFVLFNKGKNAGNALKELVQAENGALWLDEQGIIRFATRSGVLGKSPVMSFDEDNIISIKPSHVDGIINRVKITSDIRVVQDLQPIFSAENEDGYSKPAADDSWRIPANGKMTQWLSLEDPAFSADALVFNGPATDSWFTAKDMSGQAVTDNVSATFQLFQDSIKVTFTNTNSSPVSVNYVEVWGEPAKVVDTINYDAYDDESVDKYGNQTLEITDNNFFGSYRNADLFATDVLTKMSEYSPLIELTIKGDPSLQLYDMVQLGHKYPGDYLIYAISQKLTVNNGLETTIKIKRQQVFTGFVWDISVWDGGDVWG
jgi:hypothetical protein